MTSDISDWPPARSESEWVLFYLRGLGIAHIARLCRVPEAAVRRVIRSREAADSGVMGRRLILHDRPRPAAQPKDACDREWDKRYTALFRFVATQGRFPRQLGGPVERSMQRWLYNQRLKLAAGELDTRREGLLDALGDWR
ncbi:hypothetical protein GC088_09915 [Arthrobacter sp. JZ12]|uniref:helicase associated domain-containing protein n=1 Tax=Arthrobacter sp. JZ12 TaxID=2654190 RepID=UPI002B473B11|nr:helicase associated domain-containing protein [Arthrobacter sp. JZ12]WRH25345.1 hypothetical protein GC088_09915 [Arthrobacter sp. JZ12]